MPRLSTKRNKRSDKNRIYGKRTHWIRPSRTRAVSRKSRRVQYSSRVDTRGHSRRVSHKQRVPIRLGKKTLRGGMHQQNTEASAFSPKLHLNLDLDLNCANLVHNFYQTEINMSRKGLCKVNSGLAIGEWLKKNRVLTYLDVSDNLVGSWEGAEGARGFATGIADGLSANTTLKSLNISNNSLVTESGNIRKPNSLQKGDLVLYQDAMCPVSVRCDTGYRVHMMHGVYALANSIKNNRGVTSLNISNNRLANKTAGIVLASMLKGNRVLRELNISNNNWDDSGYPKYGDKGDGVGFAEELAAGISANKAIVSVNVLNNKIGAEQAQNLAAILNKHQTLKSLCGNKGDETELDMRRKQMGVEGAIMLAPEIVANGALTSLNISNNNLGGVSELIDQPAQKVKIGNKVDGKPVIFASDSYYNTQDLSGAIALANGIKNNGALTSLNLSYNMLACKAGGRAISDMLRGNVVLKVLDISYNVGFQGCNPAEFAQALADGITNNGALTSLNISGNTIPETNPIFETCNTKEIKCTSQ